MHLLLAALAISGTISIAEQLPFLYVGVENGRSVPKRVDGKPVGSGEKERYQSANSRCIAHVMGSMPYDIVEAAKYDDDNKVAETVVDTAWFNCMRVELNRPK